VDDLKEMMKQVLHQREEYFNVLHGDLSSSFSPPFFAISAPSFVPSFAPSSAASCTFSWSPHAASAARNSCRRGQRPGRKSLGREGLTEDKL
jgi:hypothetical protein